MFPLGILRQTDLAVDDVHSECVVKLPRVSRLVSLHCQIIDDLLKFIVLSVTHVVADFLSVLLDYELHGGVQSGLRVALFHLLLLRLCLSVGVNESIIDERHELLSSPNDVELDLGIEQ